MREPTSLEASCLDTNMWQVADARPGGPTLSRWILALMSFMTFGGGGGNQGSDSRLFRFVALPGRKCRDGIPALPIYIKPFARRVSRTISG